MAGAGEGQLAGGVEAGRPVVFVLGQRIAPRLRVRLEVADAGFWKLYGELQHTDPARAHAQWSSLQARCSELGLNVDVVPALDLWATLGAHPAKVLALVEEIDKVAQGRVWSGEDAFELGLVDELGDLDDAIEAVKIAAASLRSLPRMIAICGLPSRPGPRLPDRNAGCPSR